MGVIQNSKHFEVIEIQTTPCMKERDEQTNDHPSGDENLLFRFFDILVVLVCHICIEKRQCKTFIISYIKDDICV